MDFSGNDSRERVDRDDIPFDFYQRAVDGVFHEAAHAVAGQFGLGAVRVVEAHAQGGDLRCVDSEQAVGAYARMSIADGDGKLRPVARLVSRIDDDEVVTGSV